MFVLFNYDQFRESIENTLLTFLPLCSKYSLTLWPQFHHHLPFGVWHADYSMDRIFSTLFHTNEFVLFDGHFGRA